ncbi:phenylacetic acid degradation bifunctional protein PaaZ [Halobacteriovorax sp. JY17]|uniref:phenylacetic acid degradation bifunctional protein PaaZ n=1 Tax=Halobacteriovorax sp. JY17 TaxID=2014617 RepID=UPI000C6349D5|nr:phenylacetic acid degradation bifunctional protein PaaZ [Halobacteriovorax sp. JY17]PIK15463.1 MAG: phenylacetic acid degradation bifunctional protein PaaZ [Halobacteriovorax sp. JY17]
MKLQSYSLGQWTEGKSEGAKLLDASNGNLIGTASSDGLDFGEMLDFGRRIGNKNLRSMTFHERARALKALALHLLEHKEKFYQVSFQTGATKIDSWIDIEGGIGNLFVYSSKGRRELPNEKFLVDGAPEHLSKGGTFLGHHIWTPKRGCAVHINAFNFPVWGMLEKIAVNILAGVPAIVKPATATSYLTEAVFRVIIDSKILPEGSLQLISGSAAGILDFATSQDIITFTGSASTGKMLKSHSNILENNIPFNMEADSLNASILGPDARVGTEEFDLFVKEVAKEMTIKAGQKCTAVRRIIIPRESVEEVQKALIARLEKVTIGDPREKDVRMGPLASLAQREEVLEKITQLKKDSELLFGGDIPKNIIGGDIEKGAFVSPTLLLCNSPMSTESVHTIEAFGPVSTLLPYDSTEEAIELSHKGEGSLVSSIVTNDNTFATEVVLETASSHGRVLVLNRHCAKESTGHGSPMPQLVHGGPGRAGGGEEMGGIRGVHHYMQRTAIQGHPTTLTAITNVYQPGSEQLDPGKHPFKKFFEELRIGDTHQTHRRTITETDIVNFANVSWDHFYAHTDVTSLEGTIFEKRVAHGYFIISAAAGLFVDPGKGPVLANYGLDELRFIKPVYAGATISVKLTCKEKIEQEPREGEDPRGVVKWQVEVSDEEGEVVALATILTLVAKKL